MVISKIKNLISANDEKYEVLFYKYSKLKLDLKNSKEKHSKELKECREKFLEKQAKELIEIYESIEQTKNDSFKVSATDKDLQRLLMDINKTEKIIKKLLTNYYVEEITPKERMFDPELHEVASYVEAKGMKPGLIIKTVRKGFKYKNKTIKKPRVVVAK